MSDKRINLTEMNPQLAEQLVEKLKNNNITGDILYPENYKETGKGENLVIVTINREEEVKAKEILQQFNQEHSEVSETVPHYYTINTIMVPVDFSEYSFQIGKLALRLGEKYHAKVWLYHVYSTPIMDTMSPEGYTTRIDVMMKDIERNARDQMENLYRRLKDEVEAQQYKNVTLDYSLVNGMPEELISSFDEKMDVQLIIIGTHGEGESETSYLGSVAEKIIGKANVPVLAVPIDSEFKGVEYAHSIMYATDFDESDFAALKKLMRIMRPFQPEIHCVHISCEKKRKWDEVKMYGLKEYFRSVYNYERVKVDVIESEDIVQGFDTYVNENKVGLIALNTHKRNILSRIFNPSLTREMITHSQVPLLVFHS